MVKDTFNNKEKHYYCEKQSVSQDLHVQFDI